MRIAVVVPGSGGSFYCENCLRDEGMIRALRDLGHDVVAVPMYLPIRSDYEPAELDGPLFYGAVNVYLKQVAPWYRSAPRWLERLVDSRRLLRWVARRAGSTRARGLEEMTVSMLEGERGNQSAELERLVQWLAEDIRPEVVHLSNALLLGLAGRIRERLDVPVVCSLQDEAGWLDAMDAEGGGRIWALVRRRAEAVSRFVSVSDYYAGVMRNRLESHAARMRVVPVGVDPEDYGPPGHELEPPVIGYLSRMSRRQGFGTLVDAWLQLRRDPRFRSVKLVASGGRTGDDARFLRGLRARLRRAGAEADLEVVHTFDRPSRQRVLRALTVLTVPARSGQAFGMYLLEAMASGVPVLQPDEGAFSEIVRASGAGILYRPNTAEALAAELARLLPDLPRRRGLGEAGRRAAEGPFHVRTVASRMIEVYKEARSPGDGT